MTEPADEPILTGIVLDEFEEAAMKAGRPSRLTPELAQKIIEAVQGGSYTSVAFRYAGVAPSTGWHWVMRGTPGSAAYEKRGPRAQDDPDVYPDDYHDVSLRGSPYPGRFALFASDLDKAEARAEVRFVAAIAQAAAAGEWRAAETWLKRKAPERWREELTMDGAMATAQVEAAQGVLSSPQDVKDLMRLAQRAGITNMNGAPDDDSIEAPAARLVPSRAGEDVLRAN